MTTDDDALDQQLTEVLGDHAARVHLDPGLVDHVRARADRARHRRRLAVAAGLTVVAVGAVVGAISLPSHRGTARVDTAAGADTQGVPSSGPIAGGQNVPAGGSGIGIVVTPTPAALPAPGVQPADPVAAAAAVRDAYHLAFTGVPGQAAYAPLAAVEGGAGLHATLDLLRSNFPQAAGSVTVSVATVVFTSPTTAATRFTLAYTGGAPYGTADGSAVLDDGRWLVSRPTYCSVMAFGDAPCPA